MFIEKVSLNHYRNIENTSIILCPDVNIFIGRNAQGKTNFIESVYFCGTGRSHRGNFDRDLIAFDKNEAHVQLLVNNGRYSTRLDAHIKKDRPKGMAINGIPIKRLADVFNELYTVIFSPEDLQLVKAGPSERRRFMDMEICRISPVYYYELQMYCRVLKQRNNLLKLIQKNRESKDTLEVWNQQLVQHGVKLMNGRKAFIEEISQLAMKIHKEVAHGEQMEIFYRPNVKNTEFLDKLNKYTERDIIQGSTSSGPHKDDMMFCINNTDARAYGSQGQQKTVSISVKLAEIEFYKKNKGENPVLLLDDIFSELDGYRQSCLLDRIGGIQSLITTTGVEDFLSGVSNNGRMMIFNVKNGNISLKSK